MGREAPSKAEASTASPPPIHKDNYRSQTSPAAHATGYAVTASVNTATSGVAVPSFSYSYQNWHRKS